MIRDYETEVLAVRPLIERVWEGLYYRDVGCKFGSGGLEVFVGEEDRQQSEDEGSYLMEIDSGE